jgi:hypothetical protein
LFGLENKNRAELLHTHSEAGLDFSHLHVGDFLRCIINRDATSSSGSGNKNFRAAAIEGRIPCRLLDRRLR